MRGVGVRVIPSKCLCTSCMLALLSSACRPIPTLKDQSYCLELITKKQLNLSDTCLCTTKGNAADAYHILHCVLLPQDKWNDKLTDEDLLCKIKEPPSCWCIDGEWRAAWYCQTYPKINNQVNLKMGVIFNLHFANHIVYHEIRKS